MASMVRRPGMGVQRRRLGSRFCFLPHTVLGLAASQACKGRLHPPTAVCTLHQNLPRSELEAPYLLGAINLSADGPSVGADAGIGTACAQVASGHTTAQGVGLCPTLHVHANMRAYAGSCLHFSQGGGGQRKLYVVDGQQRIVTLCLLFGAARSRFLAAGDSQYQELVQQIQHLLLQVRNIRRPSRFASSTSAARMYYSDPFHVDSNRPSPHAVQEGNLLLIRPEEPRVEMQRQDDTLFLRCGARGEARRILGPAAVLQRSAPGLLAACLAPSPFLSVCPCVCARGHLCLACGSLCVCVSTCFTAVLAPCVPDGNRKLLLEPDFQRDGGQKLEGDSQPKLWANMQAGWKSTIIVLWRRTLPAYACPLSSSCLLIATSARHQAGWVIPTRPAYLE